VKITYTATVLTKQEIAVFMSGNIVATQDFKLIGSYSPKLLANYKVSQFEMKTPIPGYLISIVAGDVA
jgi:hypothetical protein